MKLNFNKTSTGIFPYNRRTAYNYAKRWALSRNPKYYDFEHLGGDCTNFASQVLHAGGCPMNNTKGSGWYYYNLNNRAPSWTGVDFLYKFLINNKGRGPIGKEVSINEIQLGDLIQLNFDNDKTFNHSLIVVRIEEPRAPKNVFIATHTYDRFDYPLGNYAYSDIRFIHIVGYRY